MSDQLSDRILLVDDESSVLKALSRLLRETEAELVTFTEPRKALEHLRSQKVSVIISDQRMPEMNGVEFLGESRRTNPDAIRILLTGYADIDAVIGAINDGDIKYYLTKPWDNALLLSRVTESLEYYRLKRENVRLARIIAERNKELKQINQHLARKVRDQTEQLRDRNEGLRRSFMQTIRALATLTEMRYESIGSHSQRVAFFTQKMLEGMDLPQEQRQTILMAAFLHDVGKMALPDAVIGATGELSTKNFERLRSHPILGQSCIYGIDGLENVGLIIRHHHENWDGTGYPDNLTETDIPLGARLIRIADAFDHDAFSGAYPDLNQLNDAAANLVRKSATLFDPDLIRRFIEIDLARQLHHGEVSDMIAVKPADLEEGMVVLEDIHTKNGLFLLPKGARLSRGMIGRVQKIDRADPIPKAIKVSRSAGGNEKDDDDQLSFSIESLATAGFGA